MKEPNAGGVMQFILPSKYTDVRTAPQPTDKTVRLVPLPERVHLVATYRGECGMNDALAKKKKLMKQVNEEAPELVLDGDDWELYKYNDPWTPSYLKTHELAI